MAQVIEEVFLVPEGKIRDFIDGKLSKLTAEEIRHAEHREGTGIRV